MTTPATMNGILAMLRSRLYDADIERLESCRESPNSYGAGYDTGFAAAILKIIAEITGEEQ